MKDPRDLLDRMDQATGVRAGTWQPGGQDQPVTSQPPRPVGERGPQAAPAGPAYRQCSVHLTEELHAWARQVAAVQTAGGPVRITASEVIRLAMSRLQDDLAARPPALDLTAELADQAHREAQQYLGRRARNLPTPTTRRP